MANSEKLNTYYTKDHQFKKGITILRAVARKTNAEETYKWSAPVYAYLFSSTSLTLGIRTKAQVVSTRFDNWPLKTH